jgi:hypothetical protein
MHNQNHVNNEKIICIRYCKLNIIFFLAEIQKKLKMKRNSIEWGYVQ